ncbi:MAG: OB-fold domain-containing protein [Betaproteobacteria bacterium]|nr:OB-fold domain-containing protein [Betaproteobacteria bacterium]
MSNAGARPDKEYFPASKPWKESDGEVRLIGMRCPECGTRAFPAKDICHECGNEKGLEPALLAPTGTLYSFSEVHAALKGFPSPYVIGYVDLEDGVRVFGQVEHPGAELKVDEPVRVVLGLVKTNAEGVPVISYKFRKR